MPHKFFISYSHSVSSEVEKIVKRLEQLSHSVWWDTKIGSGDIWWRTICENIEHGEFMIFLISEKSVKSKVCNAELKYALDTNCPVLPYKLDKDLDYKIPKILSDIHYSVYDGDLDNLAQSIIANAATKVGSNNSKRRTIPRPPPPESGERSLISQFRSGIICAEKRQFEKAKHKLIQVSNVDPSEWNKRCDLWIQIINDYEQIFEYSKSHVTWSDAKDKWNAFQKNYPIRDSKETQKPYVLEKTFDPCNVEDKIAPPISNGTPRSLEIPTINKFQFTSNVITPDHKLWKRLEGYALLSGDDHLFPVVFSNGEVWEIEYRVRKGFTSAGACDLGGFTLLDAIKAGDSHPFWESVGLPGVPMLWGASAIVTYKNKVLLGRKKKGLQFGGLYTPPGAGIVDTQDFEIGKTLRDGLIHAALRELYEETNGHINVDSSYVVDFDTAIEDERCKYQAYVYIKLNELPDLPEDGCYDEFEYIKFYDFSIEGWQALRHAGGLK